MLGPLRILQRPLCVLTAVHLDNELGLHTQDIDDVGPYDLLAAKLAAFQLAVAKPAPQQLLWLEFAACAVCGRGVSRDL